MNAFLWLWWLAGTLLPLATVWLLWRLVLKAESCFRYNRVVLLLAPVLAAAWPLLPHPASLGPELLTLVVPGAQQPVQVLLPTAYYVNPAPAALGWHGWGWLLAAYGAGAALGLARLGWRYAQVRRLARGLPREARVGYVLVRTGGQLPTSSWGRTVFWDDTAALTPAEAAPVLAHELAHVRQGHSYDVLWLELWRVLLWPNPFAHLLLPALRLTHELLADRAAQAGAPADYAALLARLAARRLLRPAALSLLQPFTFSFTLTRLAMLQRPAPPRHWKQWLVLPALGTAFLVACQTTPALDHAVPPPPPPTVADMPVPPPPPPPMVVDKPTNAAGKVYTYVEQMPELPGGGGNQAISSAITQRVVYPSGATEQQGQVFVKFVVGADGAVRDAEVVKSLAPAYDEAVLKAVQQLPKFVPGKQYGKAVSVSFTLPVYFIKATVGKP